MTASTSVQSCRTLSAARTAYDVLLKIDCARRSGVQFFQGHLHAITQVRRPPPAPTKTEVGPKHAPEHLEGIHATFETAEVSSTRGIVSSEGRGASGVIDAAFL
eukprot:CAMPEP_0206592560 /NCGR_PEP_ID=MMETSP0325_2-20121206/41037_1 /ASSEMBLY_ACC=CAM_ASM_000347 /TAXON_ID=2866 /ORGANISM="Crypthecodinium cohnii, Strain Seligo" /LENGTH=103 /DNA_ID=CAMNT_0054102225 /DNA_START=1140 /DNA_END=1448 /DNA_ORIENTATION=-